MVRINVKAPEPEGASTPTAFLVRRSLAALLAAALILLPAPVAGFTADPVYFDDSGPDLLVLGNPSYYEVALRRSNGSIAYIKDLKAGGTISLGSDAESLWKVQILEGPIPVVWANEYGGGPAGDFDYVWSADRNELTLSYSARAGVPHGVTAEVVLRASAEPYFDLRMTVQNGGSGTFTRVSFPHQLVFAESEVEEALVPVQPGLVLRSGFFTGHGTWGSLSAFTDYLGIRTTGGSLAMYSLRTPRDFWPVHLGLAHQVEPMGLHTTQLQHSFPVVVSEGATWTSPTVRLRVSQSFLETVLAVRADNDLGALPSVRDKLGDRHDAVIRAPLFHLTTGFTDQPFRDWPKLLADLPVPALVVVAAYWPGGFHGYYPDVLPPDPAQGTLDELRTAVRVAKERGLLVMPMILPSWWHEDSPTMRNLPPPLTARDIAVIDERGEPVRFPWTLGRKEDWGYNVSPYHPFVRQRLDQLFEQLEDVFQADMVYEDVIGAEPLGPDLNPSAPRAGFSTGWYEHVRERSDVGIVNESGSDMLAESAVGFLGSLLHSWENIDLEFGPGGWRMYPLAPLLVHDKVLFYQYWATSAVSKTYLAWNLAFGSMLNSTLIARHMIGPCELPAGMRCPPAEPMDGPWPKAIAEFQARVASRYAGKQMIDYQELPDGITRSEFGSVTVVRNWDQEREYVTGGFTLPPVGVLATSASGDLTAGIFTAYNEAPLSRGDHYLIEERSDKAIEVRQPIGADTELVLKPLAGWRETDHVRVVAYSATGEEIQRVPVSVLGAGIKFSYEARRGGKDVDFYRVEVAPPAPTALPGATETPPPVTSPGAGQGPAASPGATQAPTPVTAPGATAALNSNATPTAMPVPTATPVPPAPTPTVAPTVMPKSPGGGCSAATGPTGATDLGWLLLGLLSPSLTLYRVRGWLRPGGDTTTSRCGPRRSSSCR